MSGGNDDPGPWMEKVLPTFTVTSQKKTCALCELWFSVENLTGLCSWKGVLAKKSEFGDKTPSASSRIEDQRPRLYSGVQLCSFCAQLVTPEDLDAASPSPGKKKKKAPAEDEIRPSSFLRSFLSPEAAASTPRRPGVRSDDATTAKNENRRRRSHHTCTIQHTP